VRGKVWCASFMNAGFVLCYFNDDDDDNNNNNKGVSDDAVLV
jgi:hypothetical protein